MQRGFRSSACPPRHLEGGNLGKYRNPAAIEGVVEWANANKKQKRRSGAITKLSHPIPQVNLQSKGGAESLKHSRSDGTKTSKQVPLEYCL